MDSVISIKGIGKIYRLGELSAYDSLRDRLADLFSRPEPSKDFWALQDISFDVLQGETVGIIGSNGAGKSTLLKILSRITPPTTGEARIKGRVSSLLEVGTGFNPELTGRENVYLNGAILGMTRGEISRKFADIVGFAGIEKFIDTPVKRYSSGMQVRLAFAVAAHLEPEIMIVDEVLAVGDAAFQRKCLGKMSDAAQQGRTVLFVSHNMGAVKRLCQRCVWLDNGAVRMIGDTDTVVSAYLNSNANDQAVTVFDRDSDKKVQIRRIAVLNRGGEPSLDIDVDDGFSVEVECDFREALSRGNYICLTLKDTHDNMLLQSFDVDSNPEHYSRRDKGIYTVNFEIPGKLFNQQQLYVDVRCGIPPKYSHVTDANIYHDHKEGIPVRLFRGNNFASRFFKGVRGGILMMDLPSKVTRL
jgi:lipopolysaccharide transport system ATP-binding protein